MVKLETFYTVLSVNIGAPPLGQISFIFMQFSAEFVSNNMFSPHPQGLPLVWEILHPPLVNYNLFPFVYIYFYFRFRSRAST